MGHKHGLNYVGSDYVTDFVKAERFPQKNRLLHRKKKKEQRYNLCLICELKIKIKQPPSPPLLARPYPRREARTGRFSRHVALAVQCACNNGVERKALALRQHDVRHVHGHRRQASASLCVPCMPATLPYRAPMAHRTRSPCTWYT